jgi:hypothetical protein
MSSEMCTSLVRDHQAAISRWHSLFYFPLRAPQTFNQRVVGSIPTALTNKIK